MKKSVKFLTKEGYDVDVFYAENKPKTLGSYDLFIVGSGIRANKWTKETLSFFQKHAELLKQKKIALFASCQMVDRKDKAKYEAKKQYLDDIAEQYDLKPPSMGYFGGFIDFHKSHA